MTQHFASITHRSRALARGILLASFAFLSSLGCSSARVSVGDATCSNDERVLCDPHQPEVVAAATDDVWDVVPQQGTAEVVWLRELPATPLCNTSECRVGVEAFLVQDDGETVVAIAVNEPDHEQLLVLWLDARGGVVFQAPVPGSEAALRDGGLTQVTLERTAQGETLLLHGLGRGTDGADTHGRLEAHIVARSGEIAPAFAIDTVNTWPGPRALLDSDVVIARTELAPNVEIARYSREGELRWRQLRIAAVPGPVELGFTFDEGTPVQLQALHVDARGRIWGVLNEGVVGVVQLDPDGIVAWHAWTQVFDDPSTGLVAQNGAHLLIDSRDRPVVAAGTNLLRLEPDGTNAERRTPRMHLTAQEFYYSPTAHSLALDAQDRIYVARHDGPRSQRRIVIDRVPEDFGQSERFVLPTSDDLAQAGEVRHMQIAADDDVYVHIQSGMYSSSSGALEALGPGMATKSHFIARLRLPELLSTP